MKRITLIFMILFSLGIVYGQGEMHVNFDHVKIKIEKADSPTYYPKLLKRYNDFDPTLAVKEYSLIYYGFSFQENYLKNQTDEFPLESILKSKDYEKLILECQKVLDENPVSLSANEKMGFALQKLKKPAADWKKYQIRYKKMLEAIRQSGDGLKPETAFKVIDVYDEHALLRDIFEEPKIHDQEIVGQCEKFIIEPNDKYKSQEIYFDLSRKMKRQQELLSK